MEPKYFAEFNALVADTPIGKTVGIDLLRKGRKLSLKITVLKLADDAKADKPVKAPPAPQKQRPDRARHAARTFFTTTAGCRNE